MMVSVAVWVSLLKVAVIVGVADAPAVVVIVNVLELSPWLRCTGEGGEICAAPLLLDTLTFQPPEGAAEVIVIVPVDVPPPVTVDGLTATEERWPGEGTVTVSVAFLSTNL